MANRFFEDKDQARLYQLHRPRPPRQLVQRMLDFSKEKYDGDLTLAVDAGCGSGQATMVLAPHFKNLYACDVSAEQIRLAIEARDGFRRIDFKVSPAEDLPLPNGSAQLVLACASIHWFDMAKFYSEVDRILCTNGVLAIVGYGYWEKVWKQDPSKNKELNRLMNDLLYEQWKQYWPSANALALDDYVDIKIPMRDFTRCNPDFIFEREMKLVDYPKFFQTMSPYRNAVRLRHGAVVQAQIDKYVQDVLEVLGSDVDGMDKSEISFTELNSAYLLMARK